MKVMSMLPGHWAWRRQRADHHVGAVRAYARLDDDLDVRGPNESPRGPCDRCAAAAACHDTTCSYESLSSTSADDYDYVDDDDDDDDDVWATAADTVAATDRPCPLRGTHRATAPLASALLRRGAVLRA